MILNRGNIDMSDNIAKLSRNTKNAPRNQSSSHSVAFSHYNNISAQLPVNPETGKVITGGIEDQTKQCLENIKAIVESINHVMDDVVKINIFLKNISDIDAIEAVYKTFFQSYLPTRTIVAVSALPADGALLQIDAVISNDEGTPPQEPCDLLKVAKNTKAAPQSTSST